MKYPQEEIMELDPNRVTIGMNKIIAYAKWAYEQLSPGDPEKGLPPSNSVPYPVYDMEGILRIGYTDSNNYCREPGTGDIIHVKAFYKRPLLPEEPDPFKEWCKHFEYTDTFNHNKLARAAWDAALKWKEENK